MNGLSQFTLRWKKPKDADGAIHHCYSTYGRGLDSFNGAYQLLDLMPKGRDEGGLTYPMAWVRRHDEYGG